MYPGPREMDERRLAQVEVGEIEVQKKGRAPEARPEKHGLLTDDSVPFARAPHRVSCTRWL